VSWATASAERYSKFTNPVVSAYAYGRLGAIVCPHDKYAGSALFRQAITRMEAIKTEIFLDPMVRVLPVASFTGLFKSISTNAILCDATLKGLTEADSFKQRLANERAAANNTVLGIALKRIEADPDRASQLAELVLEAGDPNTIDFDGMTGFLAKLRERSAELGDEVFLHSLENILAQPVRSTANLNVIGKFLFVSVQLRPRPDVQNLAEGTPFANTTHYWFQTTRETANTDLVTVYIQGLVRMINDSLNPIPNDLRQNAQFNATTTIYLAQLLKRQAAVLEPGVLEELDSAVQRLRVTMGGGQNAPLPPEVPSDNDAAAAVYRRARDLVSLIRRGEFDAARRDLSSLGEARLTPQLATLIDFAEGAEAIKAGDTTLATRIASQLQPGVQRTLLYSGIVFLLDPRDGGSILALALRETQAMPLEFNAALSTGLIGALLTRDPQRALSIVPSVIASQNSALNAPRRWRFDPRRLRGPRSSAGPSGEGTALDIPNIPLGRRGFNYVVDTGFRNALVGNTSTGRISFPLNVPNTGPFLLPDVLRRAKTLDPQFLEAMVLELRDETQRANALLAIAELRFSLAAPPPAAPAPDATRVP
jgi:hypothetical protein